MNRSDILSLLDTSRTPMTKREIAKALGIIGSGKRIALKKILKTLENDSSVIKHAGGGYSVPDGLPAVMTLEIYDIDIDGDIFARPLEWDEHQKGPLPRIEVRPAKHTNGTAGKGDHILARLERITPPQSDTHTEDDTPAYIAHILQRMDDERNTVIGIYSLTRSGRGVIRSTNKKAKFDFEVPSAETGGAEEGDLVMAEMMRGRGLRSKKVRITKIIGQQDDTNAISLISIHEAGLRDTFPEAVLKGAEGLKVPDIKGREDLRAIPLVTIDGADARDFDDAVYAEPLDDGGYHLIVAIADVSHYVRPGSALDEEAEKRGNSTYFPDQVIPMLPEALSNDLCSLRPNENRAALAAHLWIDTHGKLVKYTFKRALIRSAARLTYEEVQSAKNGQPNDKTGPLLDNVITPLYAAYAILDRARQKRGALDLDLPERQILINAKGRMTGVKRRERLDSHKLIEEFMVLANVAAASALEDKMQPDKPAQYPCVYRIHDRPSASKIDSTRDLLDTFNLRLPEGTIRQAGTLNSLLSNSRNSPHSQLLNIIVLRCQSQAIYSTDNIGHFGLSLQRYAHFTSPIRRYADLLVHRALVSAHKLGPGGLTPKDVERIDSVCAHITQTERASMVAERSATDRFTSSYLSEHINAEFDGEISGVTRFGLFINLTESGADGLVPIRSLPDDFYIHNEKEHALIGRKTGYVYRLGARVRIRIKEANTLTGSSIFALTPAYLKGADLPGILNTRITQDTQKFKGKKRKNTPKHRAKENRKKTQIRGKVKPTKKTQE